MNDDRTRVVRRDRPGAVLAFATKGLDIRSVEQVKAWTRKLAQAGAVPVAEGSV